jgi:hypothetical protein
MTHRFSKKHLTGCNIIRRPQILFLASRADGLLRKVCNRAIWLEHGRLVQYGEFEEVIAASKSIVGPDNRMATVPAKQRASAGSTTFLNCFFGLDVQRYSVSIALVMVLTVI